MTPQEFKAPPHSIEAEQAVLGALMLNNDSLAKVNGLQPRHFYRDDHRRIYATIRKLVDAGEVADPVSVADELGRINQSEQTGGLAYLIDIFNNTPSAAGIGTHARRIENTALERSLLEVLQDGLGRISGPGDLSEKIEYVQQKLIVLAERSHSPVPFRLQTAEDLAKLEPIAWHIKRVLPKVGIGSIYGPSTAGKSFVTLAMLAACSRGGSFFGYSVAPCPCTYVSCEGEYGAAQRVRAEELAHGKLPDSFRVVTTGLDILNAGDRQELVKAIRAAGQDQGIVVFDTLNRAAPGFDENDSAAMGSVVSALKWLQAQLGGVVLVVHHTGKEAGRGPRGHSSLFAALDFGIEITRDGDRRTWINRKTRDGEDGKEHGFRLNVVDVGIDADGEPVTSCVIEEVEDAAESVHAVLTPKGGNQRIVWDGLGELLRQSIHFGQAGAPPTRPCVRLEDAIEKLRDRLACESNRRTPRTREAITGLVTRGLLNLREGWLWCK